MLKKMLTFMGGAVLFLSLTACGSSYDAFELLENSHEVMADVDSMEMEFDIEVSVDAGFMSMTMPIDGRLAMDTNANMSMEMGMSMMELDMSMEMYFRDGYLYMNEDGQRDVMPMDVGTARDEMVGTLAIGTDIDENQVEEATVERIDDGYRLEFILDTDQGGIDFVDGFIEGFVSTLAEPGTRSDLESASMVIYLDEDYYHTSVQMEIELAMRIDGMDADVTVGMIMDVVQIGNVTVQFPAWLDDMHGTSIEGHELLGTWENGDGRILLFTFGRADSVEFREDGTVVITEGRNSRTVDWEPGQPGEFTAGNFSFTYTIRGDVLTITDSADDDWTFDREGTGAPVDDDDDEDEEDDNDNNDASSLEAQLVGEWNWLGSWYYTFNDDGTGERLGLGGNDSFRWTVSGDELRITVNGFTERWAVEISGNNMTLSSNQAPGLDFDYTRR